MNKAKRSSYRDAGVIDSEEMGLSRLVQLTRETEAFRTGIGRVILPSGYFATVLALTDELGIAVSTDGVGTKIIVAELMQKFDTIGIDCIAMNVNDVVCVGATPISLLDYLAVEKAEPKLLEEIGIGLREGARLAGINIPGGEVAQLAEMIKGHGESPGIDLVGTAIGVVDLDKIIIGRDLSAGDMVIGLASSGIHSNGLTLARRVLLDRAGLALDRKVDELGRPLGEELLEPTRIYVREVLEMLERGLHVKAMAHITGDGFLNLARVEAAVGYQLDFLPPAPSIFGLIQKLGDVADEEMFRVFNMGIGFCVIVEEDDAADAITVAAAHGCPAWVLGRVVDDPERKILIRPKNLVGRGREFRPS